MRVGVWVWVPREDGARTARPVAPVAAGAGLVPCVGARMRGEQGVDSRLRLEQQVRALAECEGRACLAVPVLSA